MRYGSWKKFFNVYLPLCLSAVLIIAGFWLFTRNRAKNAALSPLDVGPVINLNGEINKTPDTVTKQPDASKQQQIQVKFSWKVGGVVYNDALYFSEDQYNKLTAKQIEQMEYNRVKNWANTVNNGSTEK